MIYKANKIKGIKTFKSKRKITLQEISLKEIIGRKKETEKMKAKICYNYKKEKAYADLNMCFMWNLSGE